VPDSPDQPAASTETSYDFGRKYTNARPLARRMLDKFFGAIGACVGEVGGVGTALEAACGEGFSTQRLRAMLPAGATLHASDVERRLVEAARRQNPAVPIAQESIYRLARPDKAYDVVFALEVLEHLDDPAAALRELCRVSRRWLILSVPREPLWRLINLAQLKYVGALGNTPGHIQHWGTRGFRRLVGRFAEVRAVHTPFRWTVVLAEVRR